MFDTVNRPEKTLRVVLADDHHFFREGLRGALAAKDITVVGEATNGGEAVTLVRELTPDVVVIDLNMPKPREGSKRSSRSSPAVPPSRSSC